MSRNSAAPGHIHKTSCTGNKAIATLDRNTLDRIECSGRLECTVNFIAVGGYHHKLARTLIAVPGGGQETIRHFPYPTTSTFRDAARPPTLSLYWKTCILQWGQDWLGRGTPHERVNSRPLLNSSFHYSPAVTPSTPASAARGSAPCQTSAFDQLVWPDMARDVAAFNLPARVGQLFGVSL